MDEDHIAERKRNVLWKSFKSGISSFDMFCMPITLNYKGRDSFRTIIGGSISIVIFALFSVILTKLLRVMFDKSQVKSTENTVFYDTFSDTTEHFPLESEMTIAFYINSQSTSQAYAETYFNFYEVTNQYDNQTGLTTKSKRTIEVDDCRNMNFSPKLTEKFSKIAKGFLLCPKTLNATLKGGWHSSENIYWDFSIYKTNCSSCMSWERYKTEMIELSVQVFILSPYLDYHSESEPLKIGINDDNYVLMSPSRYTGFNIKVRKNQYKINGNYLLDDYKEGSFYNSEKASQSYGAVYDSDLIFGSIQFSLDSTTVIYEASVYTLFDLISQVGGSFEVVREIFSFMIGYFYSKMYYHYTLNSINRQSSKHCASKSSRILPQNSNVKKYGLSKMVTNNFKSSLKPDHFKQKESEFEERKELKSHNLNSLQLSHFKDSAAGFNSQPFKYTTFFEEASKLK